MVNDLGTEEKAELIAILEELLRTIQQFKKANNSFSLTQNADEAKEWLLFLQRHTDKEELKSLENEIADRFFYKFDFSVDGSELDIRRTQLMKDYLLKSNRFLE